MFKIENDTIIVDSKDFNPTHILECGQVFRYEKTADSWIVLSADKKCEITAKDSTYIIVGGNTDYWINYFDLYTDYSKIKSDLQNKPLMNEAIKYGSGIRILKQNNIEMIFSFIISANNHIPRIKAIISRLCTALGEKKDGFYAFPSLQKLSSVDIAFFTNIGCGYRADYLYHTAQLLANGFDTNCVYDMDSEVANKHLCALKGIGAKVADCILLFGYYNLNVFPVDTWIKKVYLDLVGKSELSKQDTPKKIREYLLSLYGSHSGYAQQYLFFNKREN